MLIEKFITDTFNQVRKLLTIPSAFSWQTLIALSLFSWVMSSLSKNAVQDIIASMGWIFLIFGVSWATSENPPKLFGFSLGPWITGALVCTFVFGSWENGMPEMAFISWPPTSAVLACLRDFFDEGLKLRVPPRPVRQNIVILLSSNILISCWIQFYFVTQNWLEQYPTLQAYDFGKSAFVVNLESVNQDSQPDVKSRGASILNLMEPRIEEELSNKPWPQVERWLIKPEERLNAIKTQVQKQLPPAEEDSWWSINYKVSSANSGYNLQLQAVWRGPHSDRGEYYIKKSCQITPTYQQTKAESGATSNSSQTQTATTAVSKVNCV